MGYVAREGCTYFRGKSPRKYIQHEGSTIPCTVKTMRQLTCTDRPYKATARLASVPEYSTYCMLAVRHKVPYARRCSYSSIVGDYGVRMSTCNLPVFKSVYTYKASECKRTIIRLHCATSKSSLWNMEYVAHGSALECPRIYCTKLVTTCIHIHVDMCSTCSNAVIFVIG